MPPAKIKLLLATIFALPTPLPLLMEKIFVASVRISAIVTACFRFSVTGKVLVFEGSFIVV